MILPWLISNFRIIAATLLFGALILICHDMLIAPFSYFILVVLIHWANAAQVPAQIAPLHFAIIGLKWYILFFFFEHYIDGPQFFQGGMETLLFMLAAWLWLAFDRRPATIIRLIALGFILILVIVFDASISFLSPYTLLRGHSLGWDYEFLTYNLSEGWIAPAIGLVVGWLVSDRLKDTQTRLSFLEILGFTPRQLIFTPKQSFFGIISGVAATLGLIGLFTMQMTMPYQQSVFSERQNWIENINNPALIRIYDVFVDVPLAITNAINSIISLAPFVLFGTLVYWLLNKRGIVGILPLLALGGTLGFAWSHTTHVVYETPYLDAHQAAAFLGMITAMGFGAASHAASSMRYSSSKQVEGDFDTRSPAS
jgi:hypothetical protein